ncbi:TetR/AcrR family transcriptional regulator [Patulibacter defluvii]|uniref:TetR/AcrR family transcriptional regulator n=1 Tax=Patulibacter defluvii TaxID=3095358 RepID=UPI002A76189B|nr:TetR/AcrR family transcriptional regulator [Patulibacter sp. DM4]
MSADVDDRILRATYDLLGERGLSALTVEAVAETAGVAKTTIYRRYRNRGDLATAAIARFDVDVDAAEREPHLRDALLAFLVAFGRKLERVGLDVLGAMLVERDDSEILRLHRERVVDPHRERMARIVRAAQERGEVRPDFDGLLAMELLVGSFFARHVAGRPMEVEEWAAQAVDLLWRGLGPEGS